MAPPRIAVQSSTTGWRIEADGSITRSTGGSPVDPPISPPIVDILVVGERLVVLHEDGTVHIAGVSGGWFPAPSPAVPISGSMRRLYGGGDNEFAVLSTGMGMSFIVNRNRFEALPAEITGLPLAWWKESDGYRVIMGTATGASLWGVSAGEAAQAPTTITNIDPMFPVPTGAVESVCAKGEGGSCVEAPVLRLRYSTADILLTVANRIKASAQAQGWQLIEVAGSGGRRWQSVNIQNGYALLIAIDPVLALPTDNGPAVYLLSYWKLYGE